MSRQYLEKERPPTKICEVTDWSKYAVARIMHTQSKVAWCQLRMLSRGDMPCFSWNERSGGYLLVEPWGMRVVEQVGSALSVLLTLLGTLSLVLGRLTLSGSSRVLHYYYRAGNFLASLTWSQVCLENVSQLLSSRVITAVSGVYRDHPNEYNKGFWQNSYVLLCASLPRSRLPDLSELVYIDGREPPQRWRGFFSLLSFDVSTTGFGLGTTMWRQPEPSPLRPRDTAGRQAGLPPGPPLKGCVSEPALSRASADGPSTALLSSEEPTPTLTPAPADVGCWSESGGSDAVGERGRGSRGVHSMANVEAAVEPGSTWMEEGRATAGYAPLPDGDYYREASVGAWSGSNGNGATPARGEARGEAREGSASSSDQSWTGRSTNGLGLGDAMETSGRAGRTLHGHSDSGGASPLVGLSFATSPRSPRSASDFTAASSGFMSPREDSIDAAVSGNEGRGEGGMGPTSSAVDPRRSPNRGGRPLPALSPEGPPLAARMDSSLWNDGEMGSHSSGELWYSPTAGSVPSMTGISSEALAAIASAAAGAVTAGGVAGISSGNQPSDVPPSDSQNISSSGSDSGNEKFGFVRPARLPRQVEEDADRPREEVKTYAGLEDETRGAASAAAAVAAVATSVGGSS